MDWNGMDWNGMEWNGMDWNGMESMSFLSLLRGLPLMHPCSVIFKTYSAFNYHDITSTLFLPKTNPSHTKLLKALCDIFQTSCQHYFY